MNKKRDLQINTDFFDDNLKELAIPQAILIAPCLSERIFMKSGLNEEDQNNQFPLSQNPISFYVGIIQKIMSRKLVDHFLCCWQKLKNQISILDQRNQSNSSHSKHRRLSPQAYNIAQQEEEVFEHLKEQPNLRIEGLPILKVKSLGDRTSRFEWLNQKLKIGKIKSKNIIITNRGTRQVSIVQSQLQRANILKQIVQKLKQSRKEIHQLSDGVQQTRSNYELNYRVSKLQGRNKNVHRQRDSESQFSQSPLVNLKDKKDPVQEVTEKIRSQFANIRKQIQDLRRSNQDVLNVQKRNNKQLHQLMYVKQQQKLRWYELSRRQDLYKRQQLQQMQETKLEIQRAHLMLHKQIAKCSQSNVRNYHHPQYHFSQISQLQQKVKQLQKRERIQRLTQSIVPLNHSQYYHEILIAVPQNNKFQKKKEYIESLIRQSDFTDSKKLDVNQFNRKQNIQKQQKVEVIQAQQQDWNCLC